MFIIFIQKEYWKTIIDFFVSYYKEQITTINKNICNKVVINGIKYSNYNNIQSSINDYCNNNDVSIKDLKNNILADYWIRDLYIQKQFPNTLRININEYNPFAILTKDGFSYNLIDEYGDIINIPKKDIENFKHLLIIFGDDIKSEINNLFNLLSIYYNITLKLVQVDRIGDRRWNLILQDGILIKMPEEDENIFEAWNNLDKILNIYGLDVDLQEIDLRIKDKIYLKYKDKTAEEIKYLQKNLKKRY